ncbi:4091_t:CDS:2 [Diversispora eburnea]|uniref:4091_t:CDS:1 n=1 Tax=Diversispora eburnea TaxID=1213867 RepID=A0A9N9F2Y1_9GLOM|nr:4091_t:CDS:2 [Diversispora eburnea]
MESTNGEKDTEDSIVIDLTQSIETPLLDSIQIVNIDVNLVNDIYDLTTTSSPNPSTEVIVIDDDTPNSSPLHQRHHIESRIIIPRSQPATIASCGHIVCRVCGNRFLARKKITCPSCHTRTKSSSMKEKVAYNTDSNVVNKFSDTSSPGGMSTRR